MKPFHHVVIQSFVAFAVLFILTRIMGKRQMAQLTLFDYIAGITIGNIAGSWSLDDTASIDALASLCIWSLLSVFLAFVQRQSYRLRIWMDGRETVMVQNGKILEENLKKEKMDAEELMQLLRDKSAFRLADVELAIMENNGKLSVMKKKSQSPVTPTDLEMTVIEEHRPHVVIIDGNILWQPLQETGLSKEWLLGEIQKQGATDLSDVFMAQVDSNGQVYVDLYDDHQHRPAPAEQPMVRATLKKAQADMETFALETRNPEAKAAYAKMASHLQALAEETSPYLKKQ